MARRPVPAAITRKKPRSCAGRFLRTLVGKGDQAGSGWQQLPIYAMTDYLRRQAVMRRKLAEQADDPFVKNDIFELASVCEEVANNIDDHLTVGKVPMSASLTGRLGASA